MILKYSGALILNVAARQFDVRPSMEQRRCARPPMLVCRFAWFRPRRRPADDPNLYAFGAALHRCSCGAAGMSKWTRTSLRRSALSSPGQRARAVLASGVLASTGW